MTNGALLRRFQIQLADTRRAVYRDLDLRVAQHPSETETFLHLRVLAYCLCFEEGLEFSQGVSAGDEPALCVRSLDGEVRAVIEVGMPAPERLHKARKGCSNVTVFPTRPLAFLRRACEGTRIHEARTIRVVEFEPEFLRALERQVERNTRWDLSVMEGHLFVTRNGESHTSEIRESMLAEE